MVDAMTGTSFANEALGGIKGLLSSIMAQADDAGEKAIEAQVPKLLLEGQPNAAEEKIRQQSLADISHEIETLFQSIGPEKSAEIIDKMIANRGAIVEKFLELQGTRANQVLDASKKYADDILIRLEQQRGDMGISSARSILDSKNSLASWGVWIKAGVEVLQSFGINIPDQALSTISQYADRWQKDALDYAEEIRNDEKLSRPEMPSFDDYLEQVSYDGKSFARQSYEQLEEGLSEVDQVIGIMQDARRKVFEDAAISNNAAPPPSAPAISANEM